MAVDVRFDSGEPGEGASALSRLAPNSFALGMEGSDILVIAGQINAMKAAGASIANFTIGDFDPKFFPIPAALVEGVASELAAGQTNYPPAVGLPELRQAISGFYAERLGIKWPSEYILVGSGARPPIYAAFATIVAPGDKILFPTPTWNCRYYCYLSQGVAVPVATRPENGFMPTLAELGPHLREARVLYLNSPLNPCGTVVDAELLREVCLAIVAENRRRAAEGERPLVLIYDMVYWQLTFDGAEHVTPVGLVPEMAPYTLLIDAISKWWAATGLRVGWAAVPPWAFGPMQSLIGHIGAWAGRAEQRAVARLLAEPVRTDFFVESMNTALHARLDRLYRGLLEMREAGLPVDAIPAAGAIYLSVRFDLLGRDGIATDEDLRVWLLKSAGVGVVPFTAFGYPPGTGWVRFSVGACSDTDIESALHRLRAALAR
ncbi:MAG: aminotransferase class I/II-fold pyridoxal phosphate-dependent enzyme [Deltaproteobacteria bacterium]|nr:aminotransferase class I/II-fold pyridoxal phosphate-dependent enzyme [Deltaproteobacteria bacterium]